MPAARLHIAFVEVGHRLYEAVALPAPLVRDGKEWDCWVNHTEQAIEVSPRVPDYDRERVVAQAVGVSEGCVSSAGCWRLVPVVGLVS